MKLEFRTLEPSEIECRVSSIGDGWVSLLLYKDARVDQIILDETVGAMNWERRHSRDNANCTVSIWDADKAQWISKEDTGKESNTEAEKGLASDSFKRACFNWGIGRELYTAPDIFINVPTTKNDKGKWECKERFKVESITYDSKKRIIGLKIVNKKSGHEVFDYPSGCVVKAKAKAEPKAEPKKETAKEPSRLEYIKAEMERTGISLKTILYNYKVNALEDMSAEQITHAIAMFKKTPTRAK